MTSGAGQLDDLQAWIVQQLMRRRALEKDERIVATVSDHLTGNDRLRPVDQLEIYREQFWLRHTGALLEDFPGLSGLLGQSDWEGLVESYLEAYPPVSWTLRDLGDRFVEHVERSTGLPDHALCVDMARLEWSYIEIFDAADVPGLDANKLAAIDEDAWQQARIVFSPSFKLLQVRYPVVELRREIQDESGVTELPPAEPDLLNLALFRGKSRNLFHRKLDKAAFALLEQLLAGTALVPACEAVIIEDASVADRLSQEVGNWFTEWGQLGWVVDVIP